MPDTSHFERAKQIKNLAFIHAQNLITKTDKSVETIIRDVKLLINFLENLKEYEHDNE